MFGKLTLQNVLDLYNVYGAGTNDERAIAKGVPIDLLESFQAFGRAKGFKLRYRFRGPRMGRLNGQAHCLKQDAITFAVYNRR